MTPGSPPVDLLIVGGLTIDRLADGSSAPGGSVLHIARAAPPRGIQVAVMTVAGPEPQARAAIAELRGLAVAVEVATADATATFSHRDVAGRRRLGLERRGGLIETAGSALPARARAVLAAPIAGEVGTDALAALGSAPVRAAILQGWLRSLHEGAPVRPLPLRAIGAVATLASFDLLVASREDLLAEADDPPGQLIALRRVFGAGPALVVTDGVEGLWLNAGPHESGSRHLPVPWRVDSVSTIGAGDILAAFLTMGSGDPAASLDDRAPAVMRAVAEILDGRRA